MGGGEEDGDEFKRFFMQIQDSILDLHKNSCVLRLLFHSSASAAEVGGEDFQLLAVFGDGAAGDGHAVCGQEGFEFGV